jgi:hypothetical protein
MLRLSMPPRLSKLFIALFPVFFVFSRATCQPGGIPVCPCLGTCVFFVKVYSVSIVTDLWTAMRDSFRLQCWATFVFGDLR